MPIDTDIQSFTEYNNNCNDENTKIAQLGPLVQNTALTSADTNRIPVRRSGTWVVQGIDAYNGHIQNFGNIAGEVALELNGNSCRTAMLATVTGYTFITAFSSIISGWVYHLYIKQDGTGGHSVRWPYGASVLNMVGTDPDQITEVYVVKMPNGNLFIKCEAFQNTVTLGEVIKEFEYPAITFPDGAQAPMSFTWTKAAAISHGGTLTDLYSDWEIAADDLYTNLLFSSYNNTIDISSIQVVLTQAGSAYMRTRYGGNIDGVPVLSPWDEAAVEFSGIDGDRYWDHVIYYIPFTGYDGQYYIKELKGDSYFQTNNNNWIRIEEGTGPQDENSFINFWISSGGYSSYISCPHHPVQNLGDSDFCFEFFGRWNVAPNTTTWAPLFCNKRANTTQCEFSFGYFNGNIQFAVTTNGSSWNATNVPFSPVIGQWYHIACFRSVDTLNLAIDGVVSSVPFALTLYASNQSFKIFADGYNNCISDFDMCHFRFTKGVSRYSSSGFDIPELPFKTGNLWWTPEPKEIATNNFVDSENWDKIECLINGYGLANSTSFIEESGKTITVGGNTKIDVTSDLSSIIFDGSGDYLYIGNTGDYNFLHNGLHPWTIEFWFTPASVSPGDWILDTCRGTFLNNGILFGFGSVSGQLRFLMTRSVNNVGVIDKYFTEYTFVVGTTYHVALTWDYSLISDNLKLFVDGVQVGSATKSANLPNVYNCQQMMFGGFSTSYPNDMFGGKIYSFRISRFLRYTSNFSVDLTRPYFPTKPKVENWDKTALLFNAIDLPENSTDIRDNKGINLPISGYNLKVQKDPNGLSYLSFTNTTFDCVYWSSSNTVLGSSDFTIEMFVFKTANNANYSRLYGANGDLYHDFAAGIDASGQLTCYMSTNGTTWDLLNYSAGPVLNNDTLYHLAFVRNGGNFGVFINGIYTSISTSLGASVLTAAQSYRAFGGQSSGINRSLIGGIYSYKITIGKALYTSNFYVDLTNPYFPAIDGIADFWLDGNDYSKLVLGTGISQINDKSYNDRHATQGTVSNQPTLNQNAQNGLRALNFIAEDAANYSYLELAPSSSKYYKILMVVKKNSIANSKGTVFRDSVTYDKDGFLIEGDGDTNLQVSFSGGSAVYPGPKVDVGYPNIVEAYCDGTYRYIRVDGDSVASAANPYPINITQLGYYHYQVPSYCLDGTIYEFIGVSKILSDRFSNIFNGYLAHKWGLTDNLPATHPYKTGFPTEDARTDDYWYATVLCINATDIIKPTEIVDTRRMIKLTRGGNVSALVDSNNKPYLNFTNSTFDSIYFNSCSLVYGASDFTLEFFIYKTANNTVNGSGLFLCNTASDTTHHDISFSINPSGQISIYCSTTGSSWDLLQYPNGPLINNNEMYHIALVRDGGNLLLFINGTKTVVSTGFGTASLSPNGTERSICGQSGVTNRSLIGRLYSARITKGIARYTEDFNVDLTNPYFPKKQNENIWVVDQYLDKVILNITAKNGVLEDLAGKTITNGGSTISQTLGTNTIYFDGNDYFTVPYQGFEFLILKNKSYTLEFFSVPTSTTNYRGLMQYGTNNYSTDPSITIVYNTGTMDCYASICGSSGGYTLFPSTGNSDIPGQLNHHAVCFDNTTRMAHYYLNGEYVESQNVGNTNSSARTTPLYFGRYTQNVFPFIGHLSSFRITEDVVRYTEDFEIPSNTFYFPNV